MIRPFGESAFLVEVADAATAEQHRLGLVAAGVEGIRGLVSGRSSLLVEFDPLVIGPDDVLQTLSEGPGLKQFPPQGRRRRRIPVVYGGEHGPDLDEVATMARLTPAEVVELHTGTELRVLFGGFAPGFGYLGEVAEPLRIGRLASPRTVTPAGSVALADEMSGIYPADLPGGWRVIGRTPVTMFDPRREPPAYLVPGDRVRFVAITAEAWDDFRGPAADW